MGKELASALILTVAQWPWRDRALACDQPTSVNHSLGQIAESSLLSPINTLHKLTYYIGLTQAQARQSKDLKCPLFC